MVLFAVLLAACNPKGGGSAYEWPGTYTAPNDTLSYTITSDGKIKLNPKGPLPGKETSYSIEKNRLLFHFEGGMASYLEINEDGRITSSVGTIFKKS
jgi:6-phosphogluconolactonase (cycloisomerase 2 family)